MKNALFESRCVNFRVMTILAIEVLRMISGFWEKEGMNNRRNKCFVQYSLKINDLYLINKAFPPYT